MQGRRDRRFRQDARRRQGEGARQDVRVLVDAHFLIVDQLVARIGDSLSGDDVLDVQQVQQRGIERLVLGQWRDAVVQQLVLWLDGVHVVGVLPGEDGVVAADVLQPVEHACIGDERLLARPDEAGQAPQAGVLLQELHDGWLEVQQPGVGGRVEALDSRDEIQNQHDQRQRLPHAVAFELPGQVGRAPADAQHGARGGDEDGQRQQVAPLVRQQHPAAFEGTLGQLRAGQHAVRQADEGARDEQYRQQSGQCRQAGPKDGPRDAPAGLWCDQARLCARRLSAAARQVRGPEPGQDGNAQRIRKHPAEGRVELVEAGQAVVEDGVERRAEGEQQGQHGEGREQPHVTRPAPDDGHHGQQEGQDAHVAGRLDVVLPGRQLLQPGDGIDRVAQCVADHRLPLVGEEIPHRVVAGIAVEVGDQERGELPPGIRPTDDLRVPSRTQPEVILRSLVKRDELDRAQAGAQDDHEDQPGGEAESRPWGSLSAPQADQPPQSVETGHHQDVIRDLDVPGEHLHSQGRGAHDEIRNGGVRDGPLVLLLSNHDLYRRQKQRQPGCGCNDHREDNAGHEERTEHVRDRSQQCPEVVQTQCAGEEVHEQPGQEQLEDREPAVRLGQGEDVEENTERIERRVLTGRQKRQPAEQVRVPQGRLSGRDGFTDEVLPRVVLEDEVAQQLVVGRAHAKLRGERVPGLHRKEVVDREQCLRADGHGPEDQQGEDEEDAHGQQTRPELAGSQRRRFLCRRPISHTRQAASNLTGMVILDRPMRRSSK